jgi:hypothetical protein
MADSQSERDEIPRPFSAPAFVSGDNHGLAISTAKTCVGPSILDRKTTHFMSAKT